MSMGLLSRVLVVVGVSYVAAQIFLSAKPPLMVAASVIGLVMLTVAMDVVFPIFVLIRPAADIFVKQKAFGMNAAVLLTFVILVYTVFAALLNRKLLANIGRIDALKPIYTVFLVFIVMCTLSVLCSTDRIASTNELLRLVSAFFVALHTGGAESRQRKFGTMILSLILVSYVPSLVMCVYQVVARVGEPSILGLTRLRGSFGHPNVHAQFVFLIMCVSYFMQSDADLEPRFRRYAKWFLIASVPALFMTMTRTVWISTAVSVVCYAALRKGSAQKLVGLTVVAVLLLLGWQIGKSRFDDIAHHSIDRRSSLEWRVQLWQDSLEDLSRDPWIGKGLGMFNQEVGVMAHNDLLRIAYEAGVPAALCLAFFYLTTIAVTYRYAERYGGAWRDRLMVVPCMLLGLFISSQAVNTLRSTVIISFYLMAAVAMLRSHHERIHRDESAAR